MAHGIQVFNADGTLQFDASNRLFRSLTLTSTGKSNGSAVVSGVDQGTVAVAVTPKSTAGRAPDATVSGSTVSWNYGAGDRTDASITIMVF